MLRYPTAFCRGAAKILLSSVRTAETILPTTVYMKECSCSLTEKKTTAISAITAVGITSFMTNAPRSKERGAGMSKQIRNKFKYDIPIYHRPIISVDEATAYSGIGRTKLYELTTMENCPFVIWVGTRRVIKRKSFVEYLERQYSI